jgi:hypothetical protein
LIFGSNYLTFIFSFNFSYCKQIKCVLSPFFLMSWTVRAILSSSSSSLYEDTLILRNFRQKLYLLLGHFLVKWKCLDWLYVFSYFHFVCFLFFVFIWNSCDEFVTGSSNWWIGTLKERLNSIIVIKHITYS